MKKLSRGAIAAIALATLVPTGFAVAKSMEHGRWHHMSPETRERLDEGKLAMAKTALKLNAEQEKLWAAVETELRAGMKARAEKRAEWQKTREAREKDRAEGKKTGKPDMAERLEKMSQMMSARAERMKALSTAFKPFHASLSDEQKDVLRPLVRELGIGGGKGHRGGHWAHGGGRHGGWGHGGWGGKGRGEGRGHHERRDGGAGGPPADGGQPPAPQNAPDYDSDDAAPVPADKI